MESRFVRPKRGFTLVELLVVIAIIGILVALLLPAIQANFCLADCSVSFLTDAVELTVLQALSTIRGGETVANP